MFQRAKNMDAVSAATWAGFAVMCVGMFMAILDVQVVATSFQAINEAWFMLALLTMTALFCVLLVRHSHTSTA